MKAIIKEIRNSKQQTIYEVYLREIDDFLFLGSTMDYEKAVLLADLHNHY